MARFDHLCGSIVQRRTQPPCPPGCRRHLVPDPSIPHGFNTACQLSHTQKAALSVPTLCGAPAQHPPQWSPAESAYYTDVRCITQDIGTNRLGAAFFHMPSHTTRLVDPAGDAETNTLTRAELAPIYFALKHSTQQEHLRPICIFSDSLAAIFRVQRIVRFPHTLHEAKHQPLLNNCNTPHCCKVCLCIQNLLLNRARLGLATTFRKVRAHTGVPGNEAADAGATHPAKVGPICMHPHHPAACQPFSRGPYCMAMRSLVTQRPPLLRR